MPVSLLALLFAAAPLTPVTAPPLSPEQQQAILDKTLVVRLDVPVSTLSEPEQFVVGRLIEVGELFQDLYELARHPEALRIRARLQRASAKEQERTLYRQFQGPIATTLDNQRLPFAGAAPEVPGKNVYPVGVTREELTAYFTAHPAARAELLDPLSVVRRADAASLKVDLAALRRYPVLAGLHPQLQARLTALARKPNPRAFYAVPYAVAYAEQTVRAHGLLLEAASRIEPADPQFADYLRHRARDLLANDYEAGDASWVTGSFKTLNAQIGAYETYDDELFGQKAFYSVSILRRDEAATRRLEQALGGLQQLEDALPYSPHKTVRTHIPLGVYDVVADFGQARSTNTASILPNDPDHAHRYGRTVLMRANVLRHPKIHHSNLQVWKAALAPAHHGQLEAEGNFNRTVWHEIGHYLGPDRDANGRPLATSLEDAASPLEELKADLVSLYSAQALRQDGFYDDTTLQQVYASGILRSLNEVKPRRAQPYQTMRLIQFNWYLDRGLLKLAEDGLRIDYPRYHAAVQSLLEKVLALQAAGDRAAAEAFITRWTRWESAHEALANRIRAQQQYRFQTTRYSALGE